MPDDPKTKKCDNCDVTIGKDEKVCPACKTDLEELEETISAIERGNKVIAKRKAAADKAKGPIVPEVTRRGKSILRGLGKAVK